MKLSGGALRELHRWFPRRRARRLVWHHHEQNERRLRCVKAVGAVLVVGALLLWALMPFVSELVGSYLLGSHLPGSYR